MDLSNLNVKAEKEEDILGGSVGPLPSNIYRAQVNVSYLEETKSGALMAHIHFKLSNGSQFRTSQCLHSGKAKKYSATYTRNGKTFKLPGLVNVSAICELGGKLDISKMSTTKKTIKLYNFESRKEEPTEVNMLMDMIGLKVQLGLANEIQDINEKDAQGNYTPSGYTREVNELSKVFRYDDGKTSSEVTADKPAEFIKKWLDKNENKVMDRSKAKKGHIPKPKKTATKDVFAESIDKGDSLNDEDLAFLND